MQEETKLVSSLRRLLKLSLNQRVREMLGFEEPPATPSRVLNLTADYGAGHRRASAALEGALRERVSDLSILTLNYIHFVHPLLDQVTQSLYVNTVKVAPELYRGFYYITKSIDPNSIWQYTLNHLGHRKFIRLLQKVSPELVLCTFPTPAGVVGELKRRDVVRLPQVTVITDNAVHTQWISPYTDLYIVASDWVKEGLEERGIAEERIAVTGIPIDPRFGATYSKHELFQKYGLAPGLPTVLLLGSAYGMSPDAWETAGWLGKIKTPSQTIVVAGRDARLKAKCEEATRDARNPVRVLGFVNTMHELMAISDLAITKAGGLTVSEALAAGVPLVIHRPIPGQEEENAKFLLKHGAAVMSKDPDTTKSLVLTILRDEPLRKDMAQAAKSLGKPDSAAKAAQEILKRFPLS